MIMCTMKFPHYSLSLCCHFFPIFYDSSLILVKRKVISWVKHRWGWLGRPIAADGAKVYSSPSWTYFTFLRIQSICKAGWSLCSGGCEIYLWFYRDELQLHAALFFWSRIVQLARIMRSIKWRKYIISFTPVSCASKAFTCRSVPCTKPFSCSLLLGRS